MSYSGEAEQVVRISLNGAEVAAKLTGAAAKNIAVMLYAVLKDQHRTKGKMRLSHKLEQVTNSKYEITRHFKPSQSMLFFQYRKNRMPGKSIAM